MRSQSYVFKVSKKTFAIHGFQDKECPELRRGEVYSPPPSQASHDNFTAPSARLPLPAQVYQMRDTPYLRNLRQALAESTLRPASYHEQERHLLVTHCVERIALLTTLVSRERLCCGVIYQLFI